MAQLRLAGAELAEDLDDLLALDPSPCERGVGQYRIECALVKRSVFCTAEDIRSRTRTHAIRVSTDTHERALTHTRTTRTAEQGVELLAARGDVDDSLAAHLVLQSRDEAPSLCCCEGQVDESVCSCEMSPIGIREMRGRHEVGNENTP